MQSGTKPESVMNLNLLHQSVADPGCGERGGGGRPSIQVKHVVGGWPNNEMKLSCWTGGGRRPPPPPPRSATANRVYFRGRDIHVYITLLLYYGAPDGGSEWVSGWVMSNTVSGAPPPPPALSHRTSPPPVKFPPVTLPTRPFPPGSYTPLRIQDPHY